MYLAFVPASLTLSYFALLRMSGGAGSLLQPRLLWCLCAFSLGCCIVSSVLMVAQRTVARLLVAFALLVVNTAIAFCFGCSAEVLRDF